MQNFEINTTDIEGDEADPTYRSHFHAQLRLNSDTYKIVDRDMDTVIVRSVATQGDIVKVIGIADSRLHNNDWQIITELQGSPLDSLGMPMDTLSNIAARVIIDGSEEALEYRSKKAKRLLAEQRARRAIEPDSVLVQHILIGFQGSIKSKRIDRTKEQARVFAEGILQRAKEGEDFDSLVETYTDDSYPGIYGIVNSGVLSDPRGDKQYRSKMVRAFGDVSFSLEVGEIGIAAYDPMFSPFGWHIIKRIE
jgi:hypothetical protein